MKLTQPSLALCLLLDAVGYFTYAMPFLGEFGDLVWAPISGLIYYKLFGGWRGALGGFFSFAEEILPFTDFIPTFTLGYIAQRLGRKKPQSGMVTVAK
ncbi:hypothetical protein [Flavihumibacter sp.]|uniref:hypothetical protein n=1 Tax=Flavihumibacter sp. TaxID=1913981 RepID=UPI002FCB9B3C